MATQDDECPRCGSENIQANVTTDIPRDGQHDYGCEDCLYVWDDGDW